MRRRTVDDHTSHLEYQCKSAPSLCSSSVFVSSNCKLQRNATTKKASECAKCKIRLMPTCWRPCSSIGRCREVSIPQVSSSISFSRKICYRWKGSLLDDSGVRRITTLQLSLHSRGTYASLKQRSYDSEFSLRSQHHVANNILPIVYLSLVGIYSSCSSQ